MAILAMPVAMVCMQFSKGRNLEWGEGWRCGSQGWGLRAGAMGQGNGNGKAMRMRMVGVRAAQAGVGMGEDMGGGEGSSSKNNKRLVDVVRRLPRIARAYFRSPFRRALFGGIAILGGFYVAQTISLSFGALGVNDVIAAAMCVLFTEYITRYTRTRTKISFPVALVNNFKMGFTYGLFIDAFKLAS